MLTSRWLLPDRKPALSTQTDPREYTVEMQVAADSPLVGKTIEQAGLRHLPGVYLAEIDRDGIMLAGRLAAGNAACARPAAVRGRGRIGRRFAKDSRLAAGNR